jgi:hypothetical protein
VPVESDVPGKAGLTVNPSVCTSGESWATIFRLAALTLVVAGVKVAFIDPFATHGKLLMVAVKVCVTLDPPPDDPDEGLVDDPQLRLATIDAMSRDETTGRITKRIIRRGRPRRIA